MNSNRTFAPITQCRVRAQLRSIILTRRDRSDSDPFPPFGFCSSQLTSSAFESLATTIRVDTPWCSIALSWFGLCSEFCFEFAVNVGVFALFRIWVVRFRRKLAMDYEPYDSSGELTWKLLALSRILSRFGTFFGFSLGLGFFRCSSECSPTRQFFCFKIWNLWRLWTGKNFNRPKIHGLHV